MFLKKVTLEVENQSPALLASKSLNFFLFYGLGLLIFFYGLFATGPKLFKEPSSKSNKPIIINAIAHCCLAGKVNESQKNAVLEASVSPKIHCDDRFLLRLRSCFT